VRLEGKEGAFSAALPGYYLPRRVILQKLSIVGLHVKTRDNRVNSHMQGK
jgi:hypothetical protein